ncbi:unnamed protein product, partial [marine sediment metagenome]
QIHNTVSTNVIPDDTQTTLVNTAELDADWCDPFEAGTTEIAPFFMLDSRQPLRVPMMMNEAICNYAEVRGVQVVEKSYQHPEFSIMFMIPPRGTDEWRQFESMLDDQFVDRAVRLMGGQLVQLHVPRFELDCCYELSDTLCELGMPDAFDQENADFSGTVTPPGQGYLQRVVHRAVLRVREGQTVRSAEPEGEASGGFGGGYGSGMWAPKPVTVRLDHPFVLIVRHKSSGSILFVGRVMEPT